MDLQPRFKASGYLGSGKLDGMVALVTGGDSGIGRAVAVLYAREGAEVAIVYLEDEQVDAEETKRCVEAEGRHCVLIPGDVRDPAFCRRAVEETVQAFGKLDILVNNAAFQLHAASIEDITDERLDLTFSTNVYGYFQMARAAVPHLPQGRLDHQHRLGHRAGGQRAAARLFDHQGRDPRLHQVAGEQPARQGHPRQRGRARAGVDAAESGRPRRPKRWRNSASTPT